MPVSKTGTIIERLRPESYCWTPVKWVYIEKKGDSKKKRSLGLPTRWDELVAEAFRSQLSPQRRRSAPRHAEHRTDTQAWSPPDKSVGATVADHARDDLKIIHGTALRGRDISYTDIPSSASIHLQSPSLIWPKIFPLSLCAPADNRIHGAATTQRFATVAPTSSHLSCRKNLHRFGSAHFADVGEIWAIRLQNSSIICVIYQPWDSQVRGRTTGQRTAKRIIDCMAPNGEALTVTL